jgi:hypothetical protein
VSNRIRKRLQKIKRRIERRLEGTRGDLGRPMFSAQPIRVELADKVQAIGVGSIGLMHQLAHRVGLVEAIDRRVPTRHRTDNLTSAVNRIGNPETFTAHYRGLANHYGFESGKIQPRSPEENGDVEQRHYRFKKAVDQALMLRGSRDFVSRSEYEQFLEQMFEQLNAGRQERLREELKALGRLPVRRHEDFREVECRVGVFGTIRVLKNTYSLHSRLAGECVKARIHAEQIEVWYAQRQIEVLPRLRGENGHWINYRHVIDRLVRKPGAFENYRYKDDLFPTSQFRIAYDLLREQAGPK